MSFCLRPNVCKKCGKPLTMFEGWTCLECEKVEQEPTVDVLDKIRDEIKDEMDDIASGCVARYSHDEGYYSGLSWVLRKIDKYKGDKA